jgi:hypothetical protein
MRAMRKYLSHRRSHLLSQLLFAVLFTGGCLNTNDDEIAELRKEMAALREELVALSTLLLAAAPSNSGQPLVASTPTGSPHATAIIKSDSTDLASDSRAPFTTPGSGRAFVASCTVGEKEQTTRSLSREIGW